MLDLFSGLGGFSLAFSRAGFDVAAHSEIEPFPCRVLAHRWPDVPNLGDVTKITQDQVDDLGGVSVITGGWPCQDNSVAGKRLGHAGERSGLFKEIIRMAEMTKASCMVLENVPGLLSVNGGKDMETVLDWLNEVGYMVDVDILDAQDFGVPQRRRRLFLVCVRPDALLKKRTPYSESIAAELVGQSLQAGWDALLQALSPELHPLGYELLTEGSRDLPQKRMKQLENLLGPNPPQRLREFWDGAAPAEESSNAWSFWEFLTQTVEAPDLTLIAEDTESYPSPATMGSKGGVESTGTLQGKASAGASWKAKSSTTLTSTSSITGQTICTFAETMLTISGCIIRWTHWSENSSQAASSLLTPLREITEYARQASSQIFTEASLVDRWGACERTASGLTNELEQRVRELCASEILFERESGRRDSPPGREAREEAARESGEGVERNGSLNIDIYPTLSANEGGTLTQIPPIVQPLAGTPGGGSGSCGWASDTDRMTFVPTPAMAFHSTQDPISGYVSPALGTGNQQGISTTGVAYSIAGNAIGRKPENGPQRGDTLCDGTSHTLTTADKHAVAFALRGRENGAQVEESGEKTSAIRGSSGGSSRDYVASPMAVRRLTPMECERLQGYEDSWTAIPGAADGPRYRALGNSVAVPVVFWVASRIADVLSEHGEAT